MMWQRTTGAFILLFAGTTQPNNTMEGIMDVVDLIQKSELLIVLKWWVMWQFFDFLLGKFKIKLRKPWSISALQPKD